MSKGKAKIGSGHAAAMLRSGFKELGQVLPAFPAGSVQPVEEPGLAGNLPAEVSEEPDHGTFKDKLQAMRAASPPKEPPQHVQER